ncbi:MAG: AAA family ATPase [Gordonia sp. (in: high G+C Gram-positive bacteria)]|uniref:AAA family ATPase n=1 Tax=Gordonia sp. (in: high G+C Gram-positive bacteria) TaxID=84139 RepID=UPI0039E65CCA
MPHRISRIAARNYKSLEKVDVEISPLTVLVGPNGSGKTNLLSVLRFARDVARFGIEDAVHTRGGFDRIRRQDGKPGRVSLTLQGLVTSHASEGAPDVYEIALGTSAANVTRKETFTYKRVPGKGRRMKLEANSAIARITEEEVNAEPVERRLASKTTTMLGTFAQLDDSAVGKGPREFLDFLSDIRYLDPSVSEARRPVRIQRGSIDDSASNLSSALYELSRTDSDSFAALTRDLRDCLPGLEKIEFRHGGGPAETIVVSLVERGLVQSIDLADASFGTVRLLALLTALHDPKPPALTVVEEVDHGLHPYALDVLVSRMREASQRTQLLVASHSPTLVNRLVPTEIVICDRDAGTGESMIPARSADEIAAAVDSSGYEPGELWFSGVLGGVPLGGGVG